MAGAKGFVAALLLLALLLPPPGEATTAIRFFKVPNSTAVDPDDNLTWTFTVENTGTGAAQRLWLNESLPPEVEYIGDNVSDLGLGAVLTSSAGMLSYDFPSYPPGNRSFQVWTRVRAPLVDDIPILNIASVDFLTDTGAQGVPVWSQSLSWVRLANLSMEPRGPAQVTPSAVLDQRIWYNNTGSVVAGSVLLNVTLPPDVAFASVTGDGAAGCVGTARWVNCSILLVPTVGARSLTVRSSLDSEIPLGTVLTTQVTALYTADDDGSYQTSSTGSVSTTVGSDVALDLALAADAEVLPPGGLVNITAMVGSIGTASSPSAWLNATLPAGATLLSAAPVPASTTATSVRWELSGVSSAVTLDMELHVSDTFPPGTLLTIPASLEFLDTVGRRMPRFTASTSVQIRSGLPDLVLGLTASRTTVPSGGTTVLTVYLNNTGLSPATALVLDLSVPPEGIVDLASEEYTTPSGGLYRFTLPDQAPGARTVEVTVRLSSATAEGTAFSVNATVRYADPSGDALRPGTASVRLAAGPPEVPGLPLSVLAAGVLALAVVGLVGYVAFLRIRRGKPRIDEVFLLHRDGLLIRHFSRQARSQMDSDILSGMLIAVQNFINESFIGKDWEQGKEGLDELKFGEYRIAIARGTHAVLAAVVSGPHPEEAHRQMRLAMVEIEGRIGDVLAAWDGDMAKVASAAPLVEELLQGAYLKRR